jgi:hypothetical protein
MEGAPPRSRALMETIMTCCIFRAAPSSPWGGVGAENREA